MEIKKARTDFLTIPIHTLPKRVFRSHYYRFVHPNLDKVESHIVRKSVQEGRVRFIKYFFPNASAKGKFTYTYFRLKELEVDSANLAQGRKRQSQIKIQRIQKVFNALQQ